MSDLFYTDYLLYGTPGSGKTSFAVSAMWDWVKKKKLRNGRIISVGGEKNDSLHIPEEFTHTGSGGSLQVSSPMLDKDVTEKDYDQWLRTLDQFTRALIRDAKQGKADRPEVIVFDGWTEFNLLFENTEARQRMDTMQRYGSLLKETFGLLQRLDPRTLEVVVIATARVGERRKAKVDRRGAEFVSGDPDFVNVDYYPSYRGQFRHELPHYYSNVYYMQSEVVVPVEGDFKGESVPAHSLTTVRADDAQQFLIKNQSEHEWLDAGFDTVLYNASFTDVNDLFVRLRDEYANKEVTKRITHEDIVGKSKTKI